LKSKAVFDEAVPSDQAIATLMTVFFAALVRRARQFRPMIDWTNWGGKTNKNQSLRSSEKFMLYRMQYRRGLG